MRKEETCCFTGHRKLPKSKVEAIVRRLEYTIEGFVEKGVVNFISGGALGFDMIAASLVISKKVSEGNIRLILALPCRNQDEWWNSEQRELYYNLLEEADEIVYVSEEYCQDCMKKRNYYMVDHSAYCISALLHPYSGTDQTVRYAAKKGLHIINVADDTEI